jgi:peptidyl-prolyl cis-trans isomerase A (cyclophilin A)
MARSNLRIVRRWTSFAGAAIVIAACGAAPRAAPAPSRAALVDPTGSAMNQPAPDSFKVHFETTQGDFVVEVVRAWASLAVHRFYNLVRQGYYDDTYFFRVVPSWVVQWGIHGDPAVAAVWREARLPDEAVQQSNRRGFLSFASAGPDTRTTQVFINLADNTQLDARGFVPFARVVGGMDVVDRLHAGYGDAPPQGQGPLQAGIFAEGNAYLQREFSQLDRVIRARIVAP